MEFRDYYEVLNVARDAKQPEIKRAYRKLASKFHPDVSQEADSEAKFKEVGEAYEVLKDTEKRAAYDQLGSQWKSGQDFHPPPEWDAGFEYSGASGSVDPDFSDFFESIFGQGHRGAGPQGAGFQARGQDHHAKVFIALEDAYQGATREITLHSPEIDANGRVITRDRTLSVKVPKGVREGQHIRLAGQGMPGHGGGPNGDLYLEIGFNPDKMYRVDGRDIYLDLPVAPWEAALGAKLKVPTPSGVVNLNIPEGSQTGNKLRLKTKGIPSKPAGDLFVTLRIVLPEVKTESARKLYEDMQKSLDFNPRAAMGV
jgi:curved DNA-binding protein